MPHQLILDEDIIVFAMPLRVSYFKRGADTLPLVHQVTYNGIDLTDRLSPQEVERIAEEVK